MPEPSLAILDVLEECIGEVDRSGRVAAINRYGQALLGPAAGQSVIGRKWTSLWPRAWRDDMGHALECAYRGETSGFDAADTTRTTRRHWRITATPVTDADGHVYSVVVICRDISLAYRAEAAMRASNTDLSHRLEASETRKSASYHMLGVMTVRLQESSDEQARLHAANVHLGSELDIAVAARELAQVAAQQAQKGEAIGQLVSGIAHDFNNMLQACASCLDAVMLHSENLDDRQRKFLQHAMAATDHASTVVRRLLAFGRVHPYNAESQYLEDTIGAMVPLIRYSLVSRMQITLTESACRLPIVADAHAIEHGLLNLCINARDACEGVGQIAISFGSQQIAQQAATPEKPAGSYAFVQVKDSGPGMPPEVLQRIFEPFFTTKAEGKGSGLGLAQTYSSVRKANGFVEVQSEPGEGSVFKLAFPLVPVQEQSPA